MFCESPVKSALKVKTETIMIPKAFSYKAEPDAENEDKEDTKEELLLPIHIVMPTAMKCEQPPQLSESSIDNSKWTIYHNFIYIE